jgi:hypothetical protein
MRKRRKDDVMTEIWKPIKGFEECYEVSNMGRVKSIARTRITKGGGITNVNERILKQQIDKFGYCKVGLCKDGKHYYFKAHRLVAIAFIPNYENKPEINHKDGNKENNCVSNLEWNTSIENKRHAYETGLNGGEHIKNRKQVNQYDLHNNFITTFPSISEAERKTGIRQSSIWMCCNFRYKTAGGYIWKYEKEKGDVK